MVKNESNTGKKMFIIIGVILVIILLIVVFIGLSNEEVNCSPEFSRQNDYIQNLENSRDCFDEMIIEIEEDINYCQGSYPPCIQIMNSPERVTDSLVNRCRDCFWDIHKKIDNDKTDCLDLVI